MKTYPEAHNRYVDDANKKHNGAAKKLARLLKIWKYERNVPVSSCYLEMRAAKRMDEQSAYIPVWVDVYKVRDDLETTSRRIPLSQEEARQTNRLSLCAEPGPVRHVWPGPSPASDKV